MLEKPPLMAESIDKRDHRGEVRLLLLMILNSVDNLTDEKFEAVLDGLVHIGVTHIMTHRRPQ
jgi:hypothetical protein